MAVILVLSRCHTGGMRIEVVGVWQDWAMDGASLSGGLSRRELPGSKVLHKVQADG